MKHDEQLDAPMQVSNWAGPQEARERLTQVVDDFVRAVAEGTAKPDAALALKVTAGLGKTSTALRAIAVHGERLLSRGNVMFFVPTLELAQRAYEEFRTLAPGLPSRVIRGRNALRPDDQKQKMCERAEIAMKISGFVPSVTSALCRGQDPDGKFFQSPCAAECPYLEQGDVVGSHVTFLTHSYLTVKPPIDRKCGIALRVIDEKFWPSLTSTFHLPLEEFMRAPPNSFPEDLHEDLTRAKAALIGGLQRQLPIHDHFRESGFGAEQLQSLARAERDSRQALEIGPWQSSETIRYRVATFDSKGFIASRRRQRILEQLAGKETGHCVGLRMVQMDAENSSTYKIESSRIEAIDRDAPVLLLDADAHPDITAQLVPGADFLSIQSPPVAEIVQVSDLTLSNGWLLHPDMGKRRRAAVLAILKREVERAAGEGVLVVATKPVLGALHGDLGNSVPDDQALRQPILGALPRWFGPRTQGVNTFESFACIVVIGRLQPGVVDIETSARSVFAKDTHPILPHVSGPLPASTTEVTLVDGSVRQVGLRAHPDPRVQAILSQLREHASLQAIARLRLVSPNRKKRVVVLSNLPLPDLPVTRFTAFAALERDLEHEPDWQGFVRLEKALGILEKGAIRGTRLSAIGLATDLPRDFPTVDAAKRFRRGRPTSQMVSLCQRVATENGWQLTSLLLRRAGGGQVVPAIVLNGGQAPLATAKGLWPDLEPETMQT